MNKKILVGISTLCLMTTLTGCDQVHFGKDAVTIGSEKKQSLKVKAKKAQSSSKKTAPKKKVFKKKAIEKKVPKKKSTSKWDAKKTQKLQKTVTQWSKATGQNYRFYDGKRILKTKNGPTYPTVFKKNRFLLNKKFIKIGYSPLGKNDYQYSVVAIANDNFKAWHNTYLFCLNKNEPVILLDQSKNTNPVMVRVVKDKQLNKAFNKIFAEK